MPKKRKHYVKPRYAVGQPVLFRGEVCYIEEVHDEPTGNRPRYKLEGKQSIYSETYLKDCPDGRKGK